MNSSAFTKRLIKEAAHIIFIIYFRSNNLAREESVLHGHAVRSVCQGGRLRGVQAVSVDRHHEGDGLADDGQVGCAACRHAGQHVAAVTVVGRGVSVQGPGRDRDEVIVALGGPGVTCPIEWSPTPVRSSVLIPYLLRSVIRWYRKRAQMMLTSGPRAL